MATFRQRPESYTCHSGVSLGDEMVITVITRRRALLQRLGLLVHRRHRVIFTAAGRVAGITCQQQVRVCSRGVMLRTSDGVLGMVRQGKRITLPRCKRVFFYI